LDESEKIKSSLQNDLNQVLKKIEGDENSLKAELARVQGIKSRLENEKIHLESIAKHSQATADFFKNKSASLEESLKAWIAKDEQLEKEIVKVVHDHENLKKAYSNKDILLTSKTSELRTILDQLLKLYEQAIGVSGLGMTAPMLVEELKKHLAYKTKRLEQDLMNTHERYSLMSRENQKLRAELEDMQITLSNQNIQLRKMQDRR
jgi:hypothetical protein